MGDQVLLDEIDDLKEVIDNLKQELVEFKDVSDAKIEDLTALCDKIKDKTEAEWKMRLKAADREAREKNDTILLELEMMRQAFSGDIGGWAKKETATKEWYENEDTGEVREDEPEVMYVARSMAACDEAKEIIQETEELRVETTALKKKNKELTLALNKTKTENNAFSKQDKAWKESAKVVFKSMNNVKSQLDAQMDQIMDGLQGCTKASRRCHFFVPKVKEAQDKYQGMQERVNKQEEVLMRANAEIRNLTTQLDEATYRVNRLSSGIDAEVERLVKPMREKMSDAMVSFMKEKAGRAQERKEFADQWPDGHLMPTVLMQNRCIDAAERARRVKKYHDKNANVALTLEIKANVLEATKWEMKYDDYGREFYEHMDTKETSEEKPAIIDYKPPPGRNEKGNVIIDRDKINMWAMKADGRGRVYFEHKKTKEISYDDPAAYPIIPKGKPADTLAAEAAELVLLAIKGKIQKHIRKKKREIVLVERKQRQLDARNTYAKTMKKIKEDKPGYENYEQLTESLEAVEAMEEVYRAIEKEVEKEVIEKEQRKKAGEEIEGDDDDEDDDPDEDLSKYQFDIETVEMMASKFAPPAKVEPTPQQKREQMLAFNEGSEARKFDQDDYMGPSLLDTEPDKLDLDELRDVLETLATREEKYEKALGIVRNNINDFSYVLLDRYRAADLEKLRLEREKRELERQERLKYERKKTKKEAKIRARQKAAEAKESAAKFVELNNVSQAESGGGGGGEGDGEDGAVPKETLDEGEEVQADAKDKGEKKEGGEGDVVDEKKADDKKADETKADDKAVDAKEGDAKEGDAKEGDAKEGDAKAEDKDTDPDALGGDGDAISIDNATLYTMDMSDDEDFEQLDNDDNLEEDSLIGGKVLADPDILIYGDISITDPSQTFDDDIVTTSRNLVNFAVFCGYTNMHIEEAPEEANLEFSLRPEDMNETFASDDQWLTSSFFVSITKDRVDAIKELVSMVYDPDLGLLNSSPLATTRLTTTAEEMARGGKRSVNHPYTPSVSAATEKLTTTHALWKSQQLMAEVVRFQCQKSAVRDAYGNRFKDYKYNPDHRRVSRMSMMDGDVPVASLAAQEKPVLFTVKKVVAHNVSDAVWADQQPQFVEVAIGGWSTKVPKQVASGRALVWNDLELSALIPLIRLQLDDVTVQFFDDHELMAHTLVATGELNAAQVLGYNCGKDVTLSFDMKDRKGSAKGRVDVMVQADHYDEKKHGHFFAGAEHDPDNIVNVETNLVESEVDHVHKVPILPSLENPVRAAEGDTEIVMDSSRDEHGKIALTARSDMSKLTETSGERRMFDAPKSGREQIEMQEKIDERLRSGRQDSPDGDIDPQFDHLNDEAGGNRETPVRFVHGEEDEEEDDNYNLDDRGGSVAGDGATVGNSVITGMNTVSDALSGVYPKKQTLDDEMSNFEGLVADLRGDGVSFIKMVTGDITFNEVKRTGHRIGVHTSAKIPDFNKTTSYLHKKSQIHMANREMYSKRTDEAYLELTPMLKQMYESTKERAEEAQVNVKKVLDAAADTARKVKDISAELGEMREPARKPTEPVLPDLPPVPYVPLIPETGQLDEKKKKKKQIPNKDLKDILEDVLMGKLDDKEWDFGKYWPSKAQAIKINKARADRNEVLDAARADSLEGRNRLVEKYLSDLNKWEIDEKKRRVNLEKTKKKSRKANLKLDCFMERADRREKELDIAQLNFTAIEALQNLHVKSMRDVQSFKIKCYLEAERQKNTSGKLRKRMLMALDARKRAMELPRGALNHVQFEEMRCKAEEALRTLRLEVLESKSLLVQEGVRLRTLHAEEVSILKNEYLRTSLCLETLRQAKDLDIIVEKNQHEVLHLLEAMEKLRMIEADKDDRGLKDTVDNAGERYIPGKKFKSIEIEQCQRLIDLVMAKIDLVEGLALSSARSLTCLTEGITSKWATDTTIVRDSWVENSDYERAARLSSDAVTWLAVQRKKLGDLQKFIGKETEEMKLQIAASDEQSELMRANQESDTRYVTESALSIVNVMQEHIAEIREAAASDKRELEQQVTDVTRECQQLRDALMRSKQASDETSKLLWSMIATLQTAAQSLSARMDIIIEERDKIVVHSRLESDKMKHQLRQERKHSANLMFILHSQRGTIKYLHDVCKLYVQRAEQDSNARKLERSIFRKEIWEQIFAFTRLSTDVNELFVFFASRIANLAGARKELNNDLANNGGARILAAMCHSPRPIVRKFAARALGSLGWDGYVETRILLWDTVCYWKGFKTAVIDKDRNAFEAGFDTFKDTGKFEALLNMEGSVDEFVPAGNMSLRTIIKQRRQWALRATRRLEGPNATNQQMINMRDGVVPSLLQLAVKDGDDWEIAKNAALAISIASYEMSNHNDMTNSQECIRCLLRMCESPDAEVQTHAAVTIANLCHKDEHAQLIFGNSNAIPVLIKMCESLVVDVLEGATCALANLTCFCDPNCEKVMEHGGVGVMVNLVAHAYSENLLDLDQNDEVQANAMEMLANVSRVNSEHTTKYFTTKVINSIVLMCAAVNIQVKRHAPLVMGNIGQSQMCRQLIGDSGGVEALFLVLEENDNTIKANTLWALCNLMWHPGNQERAGRFMNEMYRSMDSDFMPIKINAAILLANALYYSNSNRVRFLEMDGAMDTIMNMIVAREDKTFVESALRAILSLSYLDNVALWLGELDEPIPIFVAFIQPPYLSRECMRYSLEILSNLCVHHGNRAKILEANGTAAIVALSTDPDVHIQDLAAHVVDYLGDVTPAEVLAKAKMDIGLERMVLLAANADKTVRAVAAESIGEEIWHNPDKQRRALELGALEALLAIIHNPEEEVTSLLPALWSLRNVMHNNVQAQEQIAHRDALSVLIGCIQRVAVGQYGDQSEKILEALLSSLTASIANHERNSRRLLVVGLEALMDIADGKLGHVTGTTHIVAQSLKGEGVVALAKSILLMLGPYNYVVCRNCHKKQELVGQSCYACGYRLRVEVTDAADRGKMYKSQPLMSATAPSGGAGGGTSGLGKHGSGAQTKNLLMAKTLQGSASVNDLSSTSSLASGATLGRDSPELQEEKGGSPILLGSQSTSTLHKKKPNMLSGRPMTETDAELDAVAVAEELREEEGNGGGGDEGSVEGKKTD